MSTITVHVSSDVYITVIVLSLQFFRCDCPVLTVIERMMMCKCQTSTPASPRYKTIPNTIRDTNNFSELCNIVV